MQIRAKLFALFIVLLLVLLHCDLFEPERQGAGLIIHVHSSASDSNPALSKSAAALDSVRCRLTHDSSSVYDRMLYPQNEYLECRIQDLDPGGGYAVYLSGYDEGAVAVSGSKTGITLQKGENTEVTITWSAMQVTLLSPANEQVLTSNTPMFDWSDVSAVVSYELQAAGSGSFTGLQINQSELDSSHYAVTEGLDDGTWYWRVRARDEQGNPGVWSGVWSFTIDTESLSAPQLSSPANESVLTDSLPEFDWSDVSGASVYQLQLDSTAVFSEPVLSDSVLTASHYTAAAALSDGMWYWRVRAGNSQGNWGGWSSVWSFAVDSKGPAAPELSSPEHATVLSDSAPAFDWVDVSDASVYEIQIDESQTFDNPVIDDSTLSSSGYPSGRSLSDGQYYWRVRAGDSHGNWGDWSVVWSFNIDTRAPTVPQLTVPEDAAIVLSDELNFSWTRIDDASGYELQVDDDSSFASLALQASDLDDNAYSLSNSLTGGSYFWRVRAQDNAGNRSDWSRLGAFTLIETGTVTDIDGNTYRTIKIGDQWWMAENLRVTHYRNGDAIPKVTGNSEWTDLSSGAYCAYDNDESNAETYGYLYNWYAVDDSRNIAPEGWRVPTDEDWKQLEMALGMSQSEADDIDWRSYSEGSKLAGNASLWNDGVLENNSAFGVSGFSALPGGYRVAYLGGYYRHMGFFAYIWSSLEASHDLAWHRALKNSHTGVWRGTNGKEDGYSVRCIRD